MRLRARAAVGVLGALLLLQAAGQAQAAGPGTPWTWGGNAFGELGDGTANRTTPVTVAGLAEVSAVTAGRAYTAALVVP